MLDCIFRRTITNNVFYVPSRSMTTLSPPTRPLIFIVGATGTGKSNLAIQVAQAITQKASSNPSYAHQGAEIINADAMQLYRGLPIITNKVTQAEKQDIPHHLLDHIKLEHEPWTVQQYVKEADQVIREIRGRGNIPIVVGGTGYYIYSLLFKDAMVKLSLDEGDETNLEESATPHGKEAARVWPILDATTPEILSELRRVDPEMAKRWHPHDRRKIQRSLEIYLNSGRKASDIYTEQSQQRRQPQVNKLLDGQRFENCEPRTSSVLRYDPLVFWLEAESRALKGRLNRRVDAMVESGLLLEAKEMDDYEQRSRENGISLDRGKGVWVSIGYKEMKPWVQAVRNANHTEIEIETIRNNCIEAVKSSTRHYAKRQTTFIRHRLANALRYTSVLHNLFLLDCTELDKWHSSVLEPASKIVDSFLQGQNLPQPYDLSQLARSTFEAMADTETPSDREARRCDICDKVLMTDKQWTDHLKSSSHKKVRKGIRNRELNEARRKAAQAARAANDNTPG